MSQYTSYWLYQKYEKRGDQDWIPTYPNEYSVDGNGSLTAITKLDNDPACGYSPTGQTQYRWVDLNPNVDYYCEDCPVDPSVKIYRWAKAPVTDYVCNTTTHTKYYKEYYQYSTDGGATWQNVVPEQSRASSDVIEYDSTDCGYIPPAPTGETIYRWIKTNDTICIEGSPVGYKLYGTSINGETFHVDCDENDYIDKSITNNYTAMTSAIVGDCVTWISDGFFNCINLTSVTISDSVTKLGVTGTYPYLPEHKTFSGCTSLSNVTMSNNITKICNDIFRECTSLPVYNNIRYADTLIVKVLDKSLETYYIKDGTLYLTTGTFSNCSNLTGLTMPNSIKYIGMSAFSNCRNLVNLTISNGVTEIEEVTFYNCTSLTSIGSIGSGASIKIPNSVKVIHSLAFDSCSGLTSVNIPDGVEYIDGNAFEDCNNITIVDIGSGIKGIGYMSSSAGTIGAVFTSSNITRLIIHATTPPLITNQALVGNYPIYVPAESLNAYNAASGWSTYASRLQAIL